VRTMRARRGRSAGFGDAGSLGGLCASRAPCSVCSAMRRLEQPWNPLLREGIDDGDPPGVVSLFLFFISFADGVRQSSTGPSKDRRFGKFASDTCLRLLLLLHRISE
jgi:hypothetical protein